MSDKLSTQEHSIQDPYKFVLYLEGGVTHEVALLIPMVRKGGENEARIAIKHGGEILRIFSHSLKIAYENPKPKKSGSLLDRLLKRRKEDDSDTFICSPLIESNFLNSSGIPTNTLDRYLAEYDLEIKDLTTALLISIFSPDVAETSPFKGPLYALEKPYSQNMYLIATKFPNIYWSWDISDNPEHLSNRSNNRIDLRLVHIPKTVNDEYVTQLEDEKTPPFYNFLISSRAPSLRFGVFPTLITRFGKHGFISNTSTFSKS